MISLRLSDELLTRLERRLEILKKHFGAGISKNQAISQALTAGLDKLEGVEETSSSITLKELVKLSENVLHNKLLTHLHTDATVEAVLTLEASDKISRQQGALILAILKTQQLRDLQEGVRKAVYKSASP